MEPRHRKRRQWWAALALSLVGCSDTCNDTTQPGTVGELGNGRFLYTCGGSNDPACEGNGGIDEAYFPDCIALGGSFDLEYELVDSSALESDELTALIYIESVNQGFFRGTDDFEALRVGSAAFLVRESERVLDLLHLPIVQPDYLEVMSGDPAIPTDAVAIATGDTEVLYVYPRSGECLELGGAVPFEAESSDETIADVAGGEVLRIEGIAPGTAVVTARIGELEQTITVTVGGGDPDTGESSESSGDTGSSSDGSTGTQGTGTAGSEGSGTEGSGTTGETSGASTEGSSTAGGT
jgi:hypothetical protein